MAVTCTNRLSLVLNSYESTGWRRIAVRVYLPALSNHGPDLRLAATGPRLDVQEYGDHAARLWVPETRHPTDLGFLTRTDSVTQDGHISVLAFSPNPSHHKPTFGAASTSAALTPHGDLIIASESASLWRWDGTSKTWFLSDGKVGKVAGCVADRNGDVYLDNLSSKIRGSLPNFDEKLFDGLMSRPDLRTSYVLSGPNHPTGLTLAPHGDLYVAINGLCPADLSLLTSQNSPLGECPASGKVVRLEGLGR